MKIKTNRGEILKKELIYKIFSKIPVLETEHLLLRGLKATDATDMFDYAQREDTTRYLVWYPHESREYTEEYLVFFYLTYNKYVFILEDDKFAAFSFWLIIMFSKCFMNI